MSKGVGPKINVAIVVLIIGILGVIPVFGEQKSNRKKSKKYGSSNKSYQQSNSRKSYYVPMLRNLPEGMVVESKTTLVEVYPGGALIERVGTVDLEPGEHRLVIPGLPDALQARSLYISGFGQDAIAGSTFLESGTLVEFRPPELVELEEKLQALEEKEMELNSLEMALENRKDLLLTNLSKLDEQLVSDTDRFREILDFSQEEMLNVDGELFDIWSQRRELIPKLEAFQEQYNTLISKLQRPVKHIVVEVTAKSSVTIPLVLQYFVSGPTWEPRHVARYNSETGQIALETYAWVSQDTGEAWADVKMRISTSRSLRGLTPPAPASMELRLEKPKTHIAGQENQLREFPNRRYYLNEGDSRTFDIDGKVSIDFGKNGKKVLLESRTLEATPDRISVPGADPEVYLNLTIQNPGIIPFLPGKTSLFNGSNYIGTSQMPRLLPDEFITIPFGQDSSVRLERVLTERTKSTEKKKQVISITYNFKAINLHDQTVVLEVRDRIPHTKNKAVKVKVADSEIPIEKGKKKDPPGQVIWKVDVTGQGEKVWDFSYTVTAPAGKRLVGLD